MAELFFNIWPLKTIAKVRSKFCRKLIKVAFTLVCSTLCASLFHNMLNIFLILKCNNLLHKRDQRECCLTLERMLDLKIFAKFCHTDCFWRDGKRCFSKRIYSNFCVESKRLIDHQLKHGLWHKSNGLASFR